MTQNKLITEVQVRPATEQDLVSIHRLVGELAEYEKALDAFIATLEDYQRDFSEGVFSAFVAEHEGEIIGMTLFYLAYSTWKGKMLWLEDFVVKEAYRQHGVGQLLYNHLLDYARSIDCRVVKWQVLDWNKPAIRFYEKNGATIEQNWWSAKVLF